MKNYNLLLFSHQRFLKIIIFINDIKVCNYQKEVNFNFQEIFFKTLKEIEKKHQIFLKDFQTIYANLGPGSYLIYRIVASFLKTLFVLKPLMSFYVIDNLSWQLEDQSDSYCYVSFNQNFYYFQKFKNFVAEDQIKLVMKEKQKKLKSLHKNIRIYFDFESFSLWKQFLIHKNRFHKVEKIETLNSIEIKSINN